MNVFAPLRSRLCLLLALTLVAGAARGQVPDGGSPSLPEGVLAEVAGERITIHDFSEEMALRGGDIPGQYATLEQRRELLDWLVGQRALVARARELGYDKDPEVVAALERVMVRKLQKAELDRRLAAVTVTDDEVAAYYDVRRQDYARPERFRAAIVFIAVHPNASAEKKAELETRAEQALEQAGALSPDVMHFGTVAKEFSDDRASRYRGGVIGWLVRHPTRQYKWEQEVVEALFSLSEPGEIAPIVHTDEGLYLVRLVEREAGTERPLDQVDDGIRHHLLRERRAEIRDAFLAEAVAEAEVRVNLELLESIEPPTPAGEPGAEDGPPTLPAG